MIELREMNPMPLAVAWLIQQSGKTNFTQEDLVERCRLGEIRLFAATPDWKAVGVGEIEMKCHVEKMDPRAQATGIVLGDGTVWISDHPLVKIRDFVSRDGLTLVSPEMASRLLIHGEASLDSVRMTVFNCGPGGETISDEPLIGTHDGRMVNFSHLRVRKSALEAFALALEGRELEDTRHESIPQFNKATDCGEQWVTKGEILKGDWPLPNGTPPIENILTQVPQWTDRACKKVGRVGHGSEGSHLWSPALFALCLILLCQIRY